MKIITISNYILHISIFDQNLVIPVIVQSRKSKVQILSIVNILACSWHQKNETTNSPNHKFKVLQTVFRIKKA